MARPRVFLSSTFYDLRYIRNDLERFINEMGYESILNERGNIPYGRDKRLEEYCYKEVELCDILISIIGGRYGSSSSEGTHSISQKEFKKALELSKQVYIFIEKSVYNEYQTYLENKDNGQFKPRFVDNPKVFEFIEEIYNLPNNNPISNFESSQDIIEYLREQWAGLFQRFLMEETRKKEINIFKEIKSSVNVLEQLIEYLTEEKKNKNEAINHILLSNHPVFNKIKNLLNIPYRVYFTNRNELDKLLSARRFNKVEEEKWDNENYEEWINKQGNYILKIKNELFNKNGKLKIITKDNWDDEYIKFEEYPKEPPFFEEENEFEVPF